MSFKCWHSRLEKLYEEKRKIEKEISDTIAYALEDLLEEYGFSVRRKDCDTYVHFVGKRDDATVEVIFRTVNSVSPYTVSYGFYTEKIEGYQLAELLDARWRFSDYGDGAARDELSLNDFVSDFEVFMEVLKDEDKPRA